MSQRTRRKFLIDASAASLGIALTTRPAHASALNLPLGLQLYSLHETLAKDFEGTLKQIAALGFREVETAGFYGHSAQQVKAAMTAPTQPVNLTDGPPAAETGKGTVDFRRIFTAARKAPITHCFVEQEAFDIPPLDALRIDADYMRKFHF